MVILFVCIYLLAKELCVELTTYSIGSGRSNTYININCHLLLVVLFCSFIEGKKGAGEISAQAHIQV